MFRSSALIAVAGILFFLALAPAALGGQGSPGTGPIQVPPVTTPGFSMTGDKVLGAHVTFTYAPTGGPIQDFAYVSRHEGRPELERLFQAVSISDFRGVGKPTINGSLFTAEGGVANLTIRDSPTALLQVEAKGPLQVVFALAPGAEAESEDSGPSHVQCVALDKPVRAAILSSEGSVAIQGNQVVASLGTGSVIFRVVPPIGHGSPGEEHAVCAAIAQRQVDAEVNIEATDSGPKVDSLRYWSDTKVEVVKAVWHHLKVHVSGTRSQGTRVYLRLDRSVATAAEARGLRVALDSVAVPPDSLTNVLYARGNNPQDVRYSALVQGPGLGLLVYIPRLTTSGVNLTIDVPSPIDVVSDPLTLGVIVTGVAVVALATVALFRRR